MATLLSRARGARRVEEVTRLCPHCGDYARLCHCELAPEPTPEKRREEIRHWAAAQEWFKGVGDVA